MAKQKKKFNFIAIYAILILVALAIILFILPDSFFTERFEEKVPEEIKENINKRKFKDYQEQIDNLLKKKFDYEYNILDSMGTKTYIFNCEGKMSSDKDTGACYMPSKKEYTEKNYKEVYSINTDYLDVENIFNLIKDTEPKLQTEATTRTFKYTSKIKDLDTDITIQTNLENITEIEISNAYMTYTLKYSNVNN